EPLGARHSHQLRQPPRVLQRRRDPQRRDAVVPPPLVVVFRRRPLAGFDEEALLEHALDGAVERAGGERELAVGPPRDLLDDRVAVEVLLDEREQDVERGSRQHGVDYSQGGYSVNGYRRGAGENGWPWIARFCCWGRGRRFSPWRWAPSARTGCADASRRRCWRCSRPACSTTCTTRWRCCWSRR